MHFACGAPRFDPLLFLPDRLTFPASLMSKRQELFAGVYVSLSSSLENFTQGVGYV